MRVFVYKSLKKPDTYLYLHTRDAFALVPEVVQSPLRPWQFVLDFEHHSARKLARMNPAVLSSNLQQHGYYLQFPASVLDPLVAGGVGDG